MQIITIKYAITIGLLFWLTNNNICAQASQLRGVIEEIIHNDTDVTFEKTPAYIVSVIDGDSTYFFSFEDAETEGFQLDSTSVFEIGSLTKTITATLVHILDKEGRLSIQDPIIDYLPQDQHSNMQSISIEHLLNHSSGLPKLPKMIGSYQEGPNNPYAFYSKANLLASLSGLKDIKLGKYLYSHMNYALLEIIIEQATGMSYDAAVQYYISKPLQLSATYTVNDASVDELVTGYNRALSVVESWDYSSFAGSEGIKTTADDLTKFIQANLAISHSKLDTLLSDMLVDRIPSGYEDKIEVTKAWHVINQKKKYDIYMHTGRTAGHHAFAAFVKETKTGVIILSNSYFGTADLGMLILKMINHDWKRKSS